MLAHSFSGSFLPVCLIRAEESLNNNKSGIFVISKWVLSLRFWSRKNLFQLCFRGVFWTSSNIYTWSFFADRASNYFCKSSIIGVIKALHTPFSIWQLTYFTPLVSLYAPWKNQKTCGFLMFSWGIRKKPVVWKVLTCFYILYAGSFYA